MEKMLEVGQIVWAKVRGYPWWPGVIAKIYESQSNNYEDSALVNFIGDPTHAKIQISKIENFDQKKKEFSKTKKRGLLNAIALAEKMNKGEQRIQQTGHVSSSSNNNEKKESNGKEKKDTKEASSSLLNHKRKRGKIILRKHMTNKENVSNETMQSNGIREYVANKLSALLEYRFTQPLSFSKKNFISDLDVLLLDIPYTHPGLIPLDLTQKVLRFLQKMISNRNSSISTKCSKLKEMIKNKLMLELFNHNTLTLDDIDFKLSERNDLAYQLNEWRKTNDSNFSNDLSSYDKKDFPLFKNKSKDSLAFRNKQSSFHKEQNVIESCSVSVLSINSSHTDCEETKHKNKVKLTPLDKKEIFSVLMEYFEEQSLDEDHFLETLKSGKLFNNMSSSQIIKHHYLRRRVCYKLFSVFEILLKHLSLEIETIKGLVKYLEMKARERDSNMEDEYRRYISHIFNKIKNLMSYGESIDEDRICSEWIIDKANK